MSQFVYVQPELQVQVFIDGKLTGWIKHHAVNQYYYQPKGSKTKGSYFNTIAEVKRSIEQS